MDSHTRQSRHLTNDIQRAVFLAVYRSREQRRKRLLAGVLLTFKHALRGMLFSWPLYLMAVGAFYTPPLQSLLLLAISVPGLAASLYILIRGVRDDYRRHVDGRILGKGSPRSILPS